MRYFVIHTTRLYTKFVHFNLLLSHFTRKISREISLFLLSLVFSLISSTHMQCIWWWRLGSRGIDVMKAKAICLWIVPFYIISLNRTLKIRRETMYITFTTSFLHFFLKPRLFYRCKLMEYYIMYVYCRFYGKCRGQYKITSVFLPGRKQKKLIAAVVMNEQ